MVSHETMRQGSKPSAHRSVNNAARAVAARQGELYQAPVVIRTASKVATDLNDILNGVALRLALLRWQRDRSRTDADIDRLALLIDQAAVLVQRFQEGLQTAKPDLEQRPLAEGDIAVLVSQLSQPSAQNTFGKLSAKSMRVLVIQRRISSGVNAIKDALVRCGYMVTVTASARQALKLLRSCRQFEKILCDVDILAKDGRSFARDLVRAIPTARLYLFMQ